jgi:hypothetical protein
MMHTELYCPTLADVDPVAAIRAIHQAWLQLCATYDAAAADDMCFDNGPAIRDGWPSRLSPPRALSLFAGRIVRGPAH